MKSVETKVSGGTFVGAITPSEGSEDIEHEVLLAPLHFEEGLPLIAKQLVEINLGFLEDRLLTYMGLGLE